MAQKNEEKVKTALVWITDILKTSNIPFLITGGLAAIAYGATRVLLDIDIDIPEDKFEVLEKQVSKFLVFGPDQFKSDLWDLKLMTLTYNNQEIDLSGAYHTKIFNRTTNEWVQLNTNFSEYVEMNVFGLTMPVIPLKDLLAYKKILGRPVDISDIREIQ